MTVTFLVPVCCRLSAPSWRRAGRALGHWLNLAPTGHQLGPIPQDSLGRPRCAKESGTHAQTPPSHSLSFTQLLHTPSLYHHLPDCAGSEWGASAFIPAPVLMLRLRPSGLRALRELPEPPLV